MSDQQDATFVPLEASASGKNAYCLHCPTLGQKMHYAACLNRIEQVNGKKAPSDWSGCLTGTCEARRMRAEERAAGRSLFFIAREAIAAAAAGARKWIDTWNHKPAKRSADPAAAPRKSMFDAIGEMGSMADVVNRTLAAGTSSTGPGPGDTSGCVPPAVNLAALPKAQAGETPLQMARRLAAERKTQVQP